MRISEYEVPQGDESREALEASPEPLRIRYSDLFGMLGVYLVTNLFSVPVAKSFDLMWPEYWWSIDLPVGYGMMALSALIVVTFSLRPDALRYDDSEYEMSVQNWTRMLASLTLIIAWAMSLKPLVLALTCGYTATELVDGRCPSLASSVSLGALNLVFAGIIAALAESGWSRGWSARRRRAELQRVANRSRSSAAYYLAEIAGSDDRAYRFFERCQESRRLRRFPVPASLLVANGVILGALGVVVLVAASSGWRAVLVVLLFSSVGFGMCLGVFLLYVWAFGDVLLEPRTGWFTMAQMIFVNMVLASMLQTGVLDALAREAALPNLAIFSMLVSPVCFPVVWFFFPQVSVERRLTATCPSPMYVSVFRALWRVKDQDGQRASADALWPEVGVAESRLVGR